MLNEIIFFFSFVHHSNTMLLQHLGEHLADFFLKFCPSQVCQFSPSQQQLQAAPALTDNALSASWKAPGGETQEKSTVLKSGTTLAQCSQYFNVYLRQCLLP